MRRLLNMDNFRDPVWQAVGTLIAIFGMIVSTFVAYDVYRRAVQSPEVTITEYHYYDPLQFGAAMEGRVSLIVDGIAAESAVVYYYSVANTGQSPICPDDYIEPLQVSVDAPWELLAIGSASSGLQVEWTRVTTNTFQMESSLLNPGDWMGLILFMSNPTKAEEPPQPSWSARIANVRSVEVQPRQTAAEQTGLGALYVGISHSGWNVYWLAAIAILLFAIGMLLSKRSGRLGSISFSQIALLAALMALSFSSADIMVSVVLEGKTQPFVAWLAVGLHSLLIFYLVWPLFRRLISRRRATRTVDSIR